MKPIIDVHCHVFNRDILSARMAVEIIEALKVKDEEKEDEKKFDLKQLKSKLKSSIGQADNIIRFLKIGLKRSSKDIFTELENIYGKDCIIAPLMFDLEYAVDEQGCHSELVRHLLQKDDKFKNKIKLTPKEIIDHAKQLGSKDKSKRRAELMEITQHAQQQRKAIERKFRSFLSTRKTVVRIQESINSPKPSFEIQLNELITLKESYPNRVYPFLAVDPRRPEIVPLFIKLWKEGKIHGVKLYTPNGYSPTDPVLFEVSDQIPALYAFCAENNIPIMVHCSWGGFATVEPEINIRGHVILEDKLQIVNGLVKFQYSIFEGGIRERATTLNDPRIWRVVLERYPKLKICLAHFGLNNTDWTSMIYELIKDFENAYTDISCITDIKNLKEFKTLYSNALPEHRKKILYGSDYYLSLIFNDSLQVHLNNVKTTFKSDFEKLAYDNNKTFLGI
jgi:predicted TIM-barrel fold metal-dependent hydrolase